MYKNSGSMPALMQYDPNFIWWCARSFEHFPQQEWYIINTMSVQG